MLRGGVKQLTRDVEEAALVPGCFKNTRIEVLSFGAGPFDRV